MEKIDAPLGKRIFDVVVSILIFIILFPFIALIFIATAIEFLFIPSSRGRFFYTEQRISQGEPFTLYKIRIFKEKAVREVKTQNGGLVNTKAMEHNKKNLTGIGRILKKIYFDELGQLINVLKGEMSLVGPRPKTPADYIRLYNMGHHARYLLKAGITGYFQSHKGLKLSLNQEQIDMSYADFLRSSPTWKIILYDTKILLITIFTVLRREGI